MFFNQLRAAAFGVIAMTALPVGAVQQQNFSLTIQSGTLTVTGSGGATLNTWGYAGTSGVPTVPGQLMSVNEGDTVSVTVTNNHDKPHNFVVQGLSSDATSIPGGASYTYTFTASKAGSYIYSDTLNSNVNREMGLYGAFLVNPADGSNQLWSGAPSYHFERIWVMSEMDKPRWNDVASAGKTVNTAIYKPNYFMMNGLGGFDAMADMDTMIHGMVGEMALVRIVNAGQFSHSLHFHGNHFQILAINNVRQSTPFQERDTLNVPPMSTADVLYPLSQPGEYPMHVHTAQMEGANGVYLNGAATMIIMH